MDTLFVLGNHQRQFCQTDVRQFTVSDIQSFAVCHIGDGHAVGVSLITVSFSAVITALFKFRLPFGFALSGLRFVSPRTASCAFISAGRQKNCPDHYA